MKHEERRAKAPFPSLDPTTPARKRRRRVRQAPKLIGSILPEGDKLSINEFWNLRGIEIPLWLFLAATRKPT
jgi:hypothetical protein